MLMLMLMLSNLRKCGTDADAIAFLLEEVWRPARSSRSSKLESRGDFLQSREGGIKVSEVCSKAENLGGHC